MITKDDTLISDLDGTLVESSRFDDDCYKQAIREVLGHSNFNSDWESYEHVTDTGLLYELLSNLAINEPEHIISQVRDVFGKKIKNYLDSGGDCLSIPGAIASISQLNASGFKVGIATGGWGHTASMKLLHAGFEEPAFLSSCDDAMERSRIMLHCCKKIGGDPNRAIYFGDANWDVKATKLLGWRFIGVGSHFSGVCAEWISNFNDPKWPFSSNNAA